MGTHEDLVYSQRNLFSTSFSFAFDMKEKAVLSDVTIRIGDRSFSAHRIILAGGIPYFRAMFASGTAEMEAEVEVTELDPTAVESLINFAYTNRLKITVENVRSLLTASKFLQTTEVEDACSKFLSEMLDVNNVMEIRNLADGLSCLNLVENSDSFLRDNFASFSQTTEFLDLPASFLNDLIRRDELHVTGEEEVFEAVMRWIKADADGRRSVLPDLLAGVRLIYLSTHFLTKKASAEKLVLESFPCRDLLDEAKLFHLLPKEVSSYSCTFSTMERRCDEKSFMYAICCNESTGLIVQKYLPNSGKWSTLLTDETRKNVRQVLALGRLIYFINRDGGVEALNPRKLTWFQCAKFPGSSRQFKYAVSCNDMVYWFDKKRNSCTTIYIFDPNRNEWFSQHQSVEFDDAEIFSFKGHVYIFDSTSFDDSPMIPKIYDPQIGRVTDITGGFVIGYLDGYSFGRVQSKQTFLDTVHKYRFRLHTGTNAPSLNVAREFYSLIPYNEKLYAIGGGTTSKGYLTDCVEVYDPLTHKWEITDSLNGKQCSLIKAVVIPPAETSL